jgi:gas vesicle protein
MTALASSGIDWIVNGGIVVGIITALLFGRLIPRRTHDSQIKNIKEVADLWKTSAETKEKALAVLVPAVDKLVKYAETTEAALTGLREVVDEIKRDRTGGADVEA